MQILKFFFGIVFIQIATLALFYISADDLQGKGLVQLIFPLLFIALLLAFLFDSLAGHGKKDALDKAKETFAKEREKIQVKAERRVARQAKTTNAKANLKVGAAFAGVLGIGALFVAAQMMTAALMTLTAAGGAATGYYYRGRRLSRRETGPKELEMIDIKAIESKKK